MWSRQLACETHTDTHVLHISSVSTQQQRQQQQHTWMKANWSSWSRSSAAENESTLPCCWPRQQQTKKSSSSSSRERERERLLVYACVRVCLSAWDVQMKRISALFLACVTWYLFWLEHFLPVLLHCSVLHLSCPQQHFSFSARERVCVCECVCVSE